MTNFEDFIVTNSLKEQIKLEEEDCSDMLRLSEYETFKLNEDEIIDSYYYDGSIEKFLDKHPKFKNSLELIYPDFRKEIEEDSNYKIDKDGNSSLHNISSYYHEEGSVGNPDNEFPYEILTKKTTFHLYNKEKMTPFHYMCENADWQGTGPTLFLQRKIEKFLKDKYPKLNLRKIYNYYSDEDKLYYSKIQDEILRYVHRPQSIKFIIGED